MPTFYYILQDYSITQKFFIAEQRNHVLKTKATELDGEKKETPEDIYEWLFRIYTINPTMKDGPER